MFFEKNRIKLSDFKKLVLPLYVLSTGGSDWD
jgi:hypothetical protein